MVRSGQPCISPTRSTTAPIRIKKNIKPRQLGGTIHVHPNGRFVYTANRADWSVDVQGVKVFDGGENNIALFASG